MFLDFPILQMPGTHRYAMRQTDAPVHIGMIGLGTVGRGVYKLLKHSPCIQLRKIAVKSPEKARDLTDLNPELITADPFELVKDNHIHVIVEVMGQVELARDLIVQALLNKKHVVTANKELIAKHGPQLFELARANNVRILFEGAVAGGIPIIMPLKLSLAGNRIREIAGILNGTTNYILTRMTEDNMAFEDALKEAQAKGFAEADPTSDVEGFDAAYKISILATIAYAQQLDAMQIHREGISSLTSDDIAMAREFGYRIKLIALARQSDENRLDIRVHPMLIDQHHPLASIANENNAIWVQGDAVGDVMFYGKGAGELPTASAVTGDILALASELRRGFSPPLPGMEINIAGNAKLLPMAETMNKYYIRLNAKDLPGVIGQLGQACGEFGISLESIMQKGIHEDGTACIVLITHKISEKQMQQALKKIEQQETTDGITCVLRVF